jgi:phospholipid/cholesterol/gamma-HCH transport system permease protein
MSSPIPPGKALFFRKTEGLSHEEGCFPQMPKEWGEHVCEIGCLPDCIPTPRSISYPGFYLKSCRHGNQRKYNALLITHRKSMNSRNQDTTQGAQLSIERRGSDALVIVLSGSWKLDHDLPTAEEALNEADSGKPVKRIAFDTSGMSDWDSGLLTFLIRIRDHFAQGKIELETEGLPEGARRLLGLASAVPERKGARKTSKQESFLAVVGRETMSFFQSLKEMLEFIGETTAAFARLLGGKATVNRSDLFALMQQCGSDALPIVSLISLLVGLIIAFVGAVQLRMFGAQLYVADLVAIGMVRVMSAVMTGIIMAGRTGAAFAAELGTMQVNEEIDALETLGISPMEYLVLPRMLALVIMMPLLCLYADLMALLGGLIVGVGMLGLGMMQYLNETRVSLTMTNLLIGLFHCTVFGAIVAIAGCLRGMQCGRSASAVGGAATSAVVTGIVGIIVATAIITIVCEMVGI